jgi:hypothetical protein
MNVVRLASCLMAPGRYSPDINLAFKYRWDRERHARISICPFSRVGPRAPEADFGSATVGRSRCERGISQGRAKTAAGRAPQNRFVEYFSRSIKSVYYCFFLEYKFSAS